VLKSNILTSDKSPCLATATLLPLGEIIYPALPSEPFTTVPTALSTGVVLTPPAVIS
tara:strand:+ start:459 stop:629 length:171 start_codon:yes stop_codon:yes gene_type:complete